MAAARNRHTALAELPCRFRLERFMVMCSVLAEQTAAFQGKSEPKRCPNQVPAALILRSGGKSAFDFGDVSQQAVALALEVAHADE